MVDKSKLLPLLVAAGVGVVIGALVGGLSGHYGTLNSVAEADSSKQSSKSPTHDPEADRKFLFNAASASHIKETLRNLSSEPHLAGTERNYILGNYIEDIWKSYGFNTTQESYDVLLSYPGKDDSNRAILLDANGNIEYNTTGERKLVPEMDTSEVVAPFNGYAKAGNVMSSRVYYVNYCRVEDFTSFKTANPDANFTGSIIICRYGRIFRGNKVSFAQENGAAGLILFMDPSETVYGREPTYEETFPHSWFLPPSGVERGGTSLEKGDPLTQGFPAKGILTSFVIHAQGEEAAGVLLFNDPADVVDLEHHTPNYNDTFPNSWFLPPSGSERGSIMEFSGDPLSPGYPAKDYVQRKTVDQIREEKIIPNIPTHPMGYEAAKRFLEVLPGAEVPGDWKGGIDITYRYGGELSNGRKFQITNNNTDERRIIKNVYGIIEGEEEPDRYVLFGNHRDAWMFGATDASSGTSIMMETSRVFYELMKSGWRPRRSIIFCSWDGEEYGIIGSIEWLDDVRVIIGDRAVAYLNCDSGVVYNQVPSVASSPLLFNLIYESAKLVEHPNITGKSLYDTWQEDTVEDNSHPPIGDLGSGSDHTGFYHRHGITSMDMVYYYDKKKMNITAYYPLYHTSYDTFLNVEKFVDPTFNFHRALTQLYTEMTRRLSDTPVLPFTTIDYANRIEKLFDSLNSSISSQLQAKNLTSSMDFLKNSIAKFKEKATIFDEKIQELKDVSDMELRRRNDQLILLERSFLYPLGILDRVYIKHVVFAPSATDSYASAAFPGIGDALYNIGDTNEEWERVKEELNKAVYTMESAAKVLEFDDLI